MRHSVDPAVAGGRDTVMAAIYLVADGRYPGVVVANLPDPKAVANELLPVAARAGVRLELVHAGPADSHSLQVRRK